MYNSALLTPPTLQPFQETQRRFTHWVRHPDLTETPDGIAPARMQVYHDLIFNNIQSFIEHSYPVTQAMLPDELWQRLVWMFFQTAQCDSPFYYDISLQFREWLDSSTSSDITVLHTHYPWLRELLHYEWLELYVDMAETTWTASTAAPDHDALHLRTTCWVLAYHYPVHTWTTDDHPDQPLPAPACLAIYRDEDDQTRIEVVTPLMALVIDALSPDLAIGREVLTHTICQATGSMMADATASLQSVLDWLRMRDLVA